MTRPTGPLAGIKVLDLSRVMAGPYATMALGELGAEVLKVERPGGGDDTRQWGPPFVAGESTYFLSANRNKESIVLDLENPRHQAYVRERALTWADVVVENFRPGTLEKWGIGLDALREANPRLITASVRGYPPGDDRPGYDFVMQAGSGLMAITGPVAGEPSKVGVPIVDLVAGLFLLSGIEAALWARSQTGQGQHVSVSLWEAALAILSNVAQSALATGRPPARLGNAHPQLAPYQTVRVSDGQIALAVGNDRQFQALVAAMGHPEWAADARFQTNPERVRHRRELIDLLESVLLTRSRESWLALFEAAGVPAGPVRTVPEALAFDRERGYGSVVSVEHPTVGPLPVIRLPWHFSRTPSAVHRAPPTYPEQKGDHE